MNYFVIAAGSMFWILCFGVLNLYADIYKYTDAKGVIHFTNVPVSAAYRLYLKEPSRKSSTSQPVSTRRYDALIKEASKRHNISFSLLKALIKAESNFDSRAVSKAGALGLMQLMPINLKTYKIKDPFDPRENIMGGTSYLKKLLTRYEGALELALAAYNAGPNAVDRYCGIPPFEETRNYVKKVLRFYDRYEQRYRTGDA